MGRHRRQPSQPIRNWWRHFATHFLVTTSGFIGVGNTLPQEMMHSNGNLLCSGSITGSSKSWDIKNPDPAKPGMRLRHYCTESDDIGGSVQYRRTIDMAATTQTLEMPSWFEHLVKDPIVMVTPFQHFGSAWGECDGNTVTIRARTLGKWHVLTTASRNDDASRSCAQEIEYTPKEAPLPENSP